ncbi:hypothetical protein B0T16DRAFT_417885 [Cercophora newfieldiana]|uniref:Uncharacterized protein n=1 Tax=Cercophora newfieldiana TaxID=92897 RepID=A0AA39Y356_9PEZI|nr:hypothetical protein B0T16DRAFT_417885 [Cercophora newfieldiana]
MANRRESSSVGEQTKQGQGHDRPQSTLKRPGSGTRAVRGADEKVSKKRKAEESDEKDLKKQKAEEATVADRSFDSIIKDHLAKTPHRMGDAGRGRRRKRQ